MLTTTDLERVLHSPEPTTWIATALDSDAVAAPVRERAIVDELARLGAPDDDRQAAAEALAAQTGVGAPARRHILVQGGVVVVDQVFEGQPSEPDVIGWGPVPDVLPILRDRTTHLEYLVVECSREGSRIRVYGAGMSGTVTDERVDGETDHLHKVPTGGWST